MLARTSCSSTRLLNNLYSQIGCFVLQHSNQSCNLHWLIAPTKLQQELGRSNFLSSHNINFALLTCIATYKSKITTFL